MGLLTPHATLAAIAGLAVVVALVTWAATGLVLRLLRRWSVLDHPNDRSSHAIPTPRGGGLAVVPVLAVTWLVAAALLPLGRGMPLAAALALGLALLSWRDDIKSLPIGVRLAGQLAAVAVMLWVAPPAAPLFGGLLPPLADRLAAGLLWLWFINAVNFMDGTDGIAGVETASIGVGVALVAGVAGLYVVFPLAGLTLAGAAIGFLVWNWQPARLFLGDVGSVPLGFLLGWLLLSLAGHGEPVAALILPAYFLADAGITLGRRIVRGERFWQAHRQHFYQRAVAAGMSHASVARHVLAVNGVLIGLALLAAAGQPGPALGGAALAVTALLMRLAGPRRRRPLDAPDASP